MRSTPQRYRVGVCLWPAYDTVFLALQDLLEPFGITRFTRMDGGVRAAYPPRQHVVGKENTQKSRANILTCGRDQTARAPHHLFSKTTTMHDLVIGLFINRYEFVRLL